MPALDYTEMFKPKRNRFGLPQSALPVGYDDESDDDELEEASMPMGPQPTGDRRPMDERLPTEGPNPDLGRGSSAPNLSTLGRTIENRGRGARPFPQRRSDLGMGAYEDNGEVKKMSKWEKALGMISSGVAGFGAGAGAGMRVSRDYFDRPYNEALGRAQTEEAQRVRENEELGRSEDRSLRRRQIEAEAARDEASARIAGQARPSVTAAGTVTTDKGVMQWNPDTRRYDIPVGGRPVSERTDPQEEQDWEWFQKNPPIDPKTKKPYPVDRGGFRAWQDSRKVANQVTVVNARSAADRPLTNAQRIQEERRLRSELRDDLKDMDIPRLESAAKTIRVFGDRAIKEGSGAATDGIIVAFNKMIDAGSVVRESEFARTLQIGSLVDRLQGMVSRITVGQRLAPPVIKDLHDTAMALDAELQKYRKNAEEHYRNLATDIGVNPDHVMRAPSMSSPSGPAVGTVVNGHRFKGGDPNDKSNWEKVVK